MKRLFLIPLAFAALASCTQHEEGLENGPTEVANSWLSVNIVASNGMTRAAQDDNAGVNDDYENGTSEESNITEIAFYFFDADGNGVSVNDFGGNLLTYDATTTTPDETHKGHKDEQMITAQLLLKTAKENKNKLPKQLVAIINPNSAFLGTLGVSPSIDDLKGVTADFAASDYTTDGKFVMSNSVYSDADGTKEIFAAQITDDNIKENENEAKLNPVTIHVERVVAKVSVAVSSTITLTEAEGVAKTVSIESGTYAGKTGYYTGTKIKRSKWDAESGTFTAQDQEEVPVYAVFGNWIATATADKANLVKEIDPTWKDEDLFTAWSFDKYFRSFWAKNPAGVNYNYFSYSDANANGKGVSQTATFNYVQENAGGSVSDYAPDTKTSVLLPATLVDASGNPIELARYGFQDYTLDGLMNIYLNWLKDAGYRKYTGNGDKNDENTTSVKTFTANDIKLITHAELDGNDDNVGETDNRYRVYVTLNGDNWKEEDTYSQIILLGGEEPSTVEAATLAEALEARPYAMVWTTGDTYYYFDIQHLGKNAGKGDYGVVRNHIYKCVINKLVGLGTPVFDPEEEIVPEHPNEDAVMLAAEIYILSWRVVDNSVDLEW